MVSVWTIIYCTDKNLNYILDIEKRGTECIRIFEFKLFFNTIVNLYNNFVNAIIIILNYPIMSVYR